MKTKRLLILIGIAPALLFSNSNFGQAPNLGTATNFVFFTTTGAVSNAGISQMTGYVGSNAGAISGFAGLNGIIDSVNAASVQCASDLGVAYNQLSSTVATFFPGVLLGNGQVLDSGVYSIGAATSLNGVLTLDGQGNSNAVFIIKIQGAFSTNASSSVKLINAASACNVFWDVEGAVSMAVNSTMRGTVIVNNAAFSMTPGDSLEGRALSTTGAIAVSGVWAFNGCGLFILLPVNLLSFTGICDRQDVVLTWSTGSETNNKFFTVQRSADAINWKDLGTIQGAGNSPVVNTYSYTDKQQYTQAISYYRLSQTDFMGNNEYGNIIAIEKCEIADPEHLTIFPNPSNGKFDIIFTGEKNQVSSTDIFNSLGEKVYESTGLQSNVDLSGKSSGMYIVQIHLNSKIITQEIILNKD
jgi:Ice-binding-like/Secretion system C-terminal sorting domain